MANCSFKKTPEEMEIYKSGGNGAWMNNCEGIFIAWAANPESIKKILPPPLQMLAPVVSAYIIEAHDPTFTNSYKEAALILPALYNGKPGLYPISMLLQGSDNAVFTGRDEYGIPKKNADSIRLYRMGNSAHATVERYGVKLIDVTCEIGQYNASGMAEQVFGDTTPEKAIDGREFFYKYSIDKDERGVSSFSNLNLLELHGQMKYHSWEAASAQVALQSTENDPWAELQAVNVLGAAWTKLDIGLLGAKANSLDNVDEIIPYLLNRYDSPIFGKVNKVL